MPYRTKEEHNAWRRRVYKQRREEFFADKCCIDCGSGIFLEIDHVDPKTKVTHRIWLHAKERREQELQKCVVRCQSCHKNRHRKKGGDGASGYIFTQEVREKLSKAKKGKPPNNKGKPQREETKALRSKTLSGRKLSDEHKKNIAKANAGKPGNRNFIWINNGITQTMQSKDAPLPDGYKPGRFPHANEKARTT